MARNFWDSRITMDSDLDILIVDLSPVSLTELALRMTLAPKPWPIDKVFIPGYEPNEEKMKKTIKKKKLCPRCKKRKATTSMDHFELTGEYTRENKIYPMCRNCKLGIEVNKEIYRQMRDMNASEDEKISGDYEPF